MGKRIISLVSALAFIACSSDKKVTEKKPTSVEVAKVLQEDVPIYIDAVGNVNAWSSIEIRSQVTGILEEVHIDEGQEIKAGQLIYTIDPAPFKASLQKAEAQLQENLANLRLAEDKLLRYKDLAEQDYISQLQFDEIVTNVELMKAKVDVDKAQIEEARIQLEYAYIRSPINGKISYNVLNAGNLVTANSQEPLISVRQMDPVFIDFNIPQQDFLKLQKQHEGEQTKFLYHISDGSEKKDIKEGVVYFIDNNFNENTGTILLRGKIPNSDYSLWPGEFGKIQLVVKTVKEGILVPVAAVQIGQKDKYVFVLQADNTVKTQEVTIVETYNDYFLVKDGVMPGDRVVTSGQVNLQNGMKVEVKERSSESRPSETKQKKAA